jgi:carboxymethylenebutenolidase
VNTPRPAAIWLATFASGGSLLLLGALVGEQAQPPAPAPRGQELPSFLKEFKANREPPVVTAEITIVSAVGPVRAYLARQDARKPLPAVLLLHDDNGLTPWMKASARDLAGIGYVVLVPDLGQCDRAAKAKASVEERTLTELSAAVRWLRRRADVLPGRVGVVGWGAGAGQALALASATPLQACVCCCGPLPDDMALLAPLRATPLLVLIAGKNAALPVFRKALEAGQVFYKVRVFARVSSGFMVQPADPRAHAQAEEAWRVIYNFLGKYVEDAPENAPQFGANNRPEPPKAAVATIADLMQSINGPAGVRVALVQALAKEPAGTRAWSEVRADAALVAEAGRLLGQLRPPRGSLSDWRAKAQAFAGTARRVVAAADHRDYAAARRALEQLGGQCKACHQRHR